MGLRTLGLFQCILAVTCIPLATLMGPRGLGLVRPLEIQYVESTTGSLLSTIQADSIQLSPTVKVPCLISVNPSQAPLTSIGNTLYTACALAPNPITGLNAVAILSTTPPFTPLQLVAWTNAIPNTTSITQIATDGFMNFWLLVNGADASTGGTSPGIGSILYSWSLRGNGPVIVSSTQQDGFNYRGLGFQGNQLTAFGNLNTSSVSQIVNFGLQPPLGPTRPIPLPGIQPIAGGQLYLYAYNQTSRTRIWTVQYGSLPSNGMGTSLVQWNLNAATNTWNTSGSFPWNLTLGLPTSISVNDLGYQSVVYASTGTNLVEITAVGLSIVTRIVRTVMPDIAMRTSIPVSVTFPSATATVSMTATASPSIMATLTPPVSATSSASTSSTASAEPTATAEPSLSSPKATRSAYSTATPTPSASGTESARSSFNPQPAPFVPAGSVTPPPPESSPAPVGAIVGGVVGGGAALLGVAAAVKYGSTALTAKASKASKPSVPRKTRMSVSLPTDVTYSSNPTFSLAANQWAQLQHARSASIANQTATVLETNSPLHIHKVKNTFGPVLTDWPDGTVVGASV